MENVFKVDISKKKKIQKNYIKTRKGATVLSLMFMFVLVIFNVAFPIYGLGIKSTFLIQDITASDYGEKNKLIVWVVWITVDIIIFFLWFIQKIVINGIGGKFINQRINESLIISDNEIEYGYQNLSGSSVGDRVVVRVPIVGISQIKINRNIARIEVVGLVSSKYYENYSQKKTRAPKNNYKEGSLVIFDYFEPEIIKFFEENYSDRVEVE